MRKWVSGDEASLARAAGGRGIDCPVPPPCVCFPARHRMVSGISGPFYSQIASVVCKSLFRERLHNDLTSSNPEVV